MTRPTVPAVSAEAQAVLDAAEEWFAAWERRPTFTSMDGPLWDAVKAMREAKPAPSPVLPSEPDDRGPRKRRRGDNLLDPSEPLGIRIAARLTERERANEQASRLAWEDLAVDSAVYHRGMKEAYANARNIVAEECQRTPVRPVSEVVDRADAQELAERLGWHLRRRHNDEIHVVDFAVCEDCASDRALLARFDAPGVTA